MDYAGFKAFLTTFLWRDGDTVLTANLDSLITMANAELNRVFKVEDRATTAVLSVTDVVLELPGDYREMRSLSIADLGPCEYLSPLEFARQDMWNRSRQRLPIFTLQNGDVKLSGNFTADSPVDATLVYYANIPDFAVTNTSWVADNYLDVYAYCALKHSAPFLREDDRLQTWASLYSDALDKAMTENAARKYPGSPQKITFGGGVQQ